MRDETPLTRIWRRRWIVLATVLVFAAVAGALSTQLPKVYTASSTLLVVQTADRQSFDAAQAAQVTARTYADIMSGENFAALVAPQVGGGLSVAKIRSSVSFEPVAQTQLLKVTAEASSPALAQKLAGAYATVFEDYARTRLASTTKAGVTVADAAALPRVPTRPRPLLYTVLAALIGLAAGVGLALLRDRLDARLRSPEEAEERLGVPVLARVPRRAQDPASALAFDEGFRLLRTSVRYATGDARLRSLAVTSSSEGEGKTTTAFNLAMATVETGLNVLVVEADVHRPALREQLGELDGVDGDRRGLTSYLAGAVSLPDIIRPTRSPNVRIIAAGPRPPSLSGMLESSRGRELVDALHGYADLVILDCPPLDVGADAAVLAARVDGVILVADLKISTDHRLRLARRQLESMGARLLGAVINRDATFRASDYVYGREEEAPATPRAGRGLKGRRAALGASPRASADQ